MVTHAMVPTVYQVHGNSVRVYFSGRDQENRSQIGFFEFDVTNPFKILRISEKPVLHIGELGCFDDNGVTPSWIVAHQDKLYLYYIGWNRKSTVRMSLIAGLAVSTDKGETFTRYSRAPLLSRTNAEPLAILTGPCVLIDEKVWKMWYVSGTAWVNPDLPKYNIKYAESDDGIHWRREGVVCIDFKSPEEHALARPCVLKENGLFKMWYSYKGSDYRIGYAESLDGIHWTRMDDQAGIDVSTSGWDSQMIEYACVFNHQGKKYMLYNGNNYGADGIGLAQEI